MNNISKLQVFSHGFLQDALTLMKVMERENLTPDDIREYLACLFNEVKKKESGESLKHKEKKSSQTSNGAKEAPDMRE